MRFFLEMLNYKGNAQEGFTPTDVAPSRYNKPGTGNRSLSFNAGVEWGDEQCALLHRISTL
jgi:hypothetical protein